MKTEKITYEDLARMDENFDFYDEKLTRYFISEYAPDGLEGCEFDDADGRWRCGKIDEKTGNVDITCIGNSPEENVGMLSGVPIIEALWDIDHSDSDFSAEDYFQLDKPSKWLRREYFSDIELPDYVNPYYD